MNRRILIWATIIFAGTTCELTGGERLSNDNDEATLIIVASLFSPDFRTNEFIILRSSSTQTRWTATASTKHDTEEGVIDINTDQLRRLLERLPDRDDLDKDNREPSEKMATGAFYSIVYFDSRGVQKRIALDQSQRTSLAKDDLARSVFDVIRRQGFYGKANPMLNILLPLGALRATDVRRK